MARDRFAVALLAYGLLNATLYSGLLPLWDGYDEPFHYANVQHVRERRQFPRLGETRLSEEVWSSLEAAPVSHIVQRNIPGTITFAEYFRLPAEERSRLRARLYNLGPPATGVPENYEAHQAPLAYLAMSPLDALWKGAPLPVRVRRLRLVCSWVAVTLTLLGALRLAGLLGLGAAWRGAVGFLAMSLQMFYASTAHVCNDWLSIPLFTWFLVGAVSFRARPVLCLAALSAGLLAKAYFLAVVPVAAAVAWMGRRAIRPLALLCLLGPAAWYGRNVVVYGSVSGMQEARGGPSLATVIDAARRLPWGESLDLASHSALWSGNNSDTRFHRRTVDAMLLLLAVGIALFAAGARSMTAAHGIVAGTVVLYCGALAFTTAQSYWYTRGEGIAPSPWFIQPIYVAVLCLALSGAAAFPRIGKAVAIAAVWLWGYVISATYWLKLIPFYGGYPYPHAQPGRVWRWYTTEFPAALDATALMSSGWVLALASAVVVMTIGMGGWLTRRLIQSEP
jgi:hypothetical protein